MASGAGQKSDPAAIDRVRRDLAELGTDAASAPDVPAAVTARVAAALRAAPPPPTHAVRRPVPRLQLVGLILGVAAVIAVIVGGAVMLTRDPAPASSAGPTAKRITVSVPAPNIPLSDTQVVALLSRSPDYGPLADPQLRASCLKGLGYPADTQVLGAQPVDMAGRPAVLMLLPGDTTDTVVALAVEPTCSSANSGLVADSVVTRP